MKKQIAYVTKELSPQTKIMMSKSEFSKSYTRRNEPYFNEFEGNKTTSK
jgi:hypothetical protein|tara:strand:+ start:148 stop:294 length:147 start_codon:yes stop_codon:yes gene_type:complete